MDIIDLLFLIPLIFGGFKGFRKGLVIELATFAALLLGVFGAVNLTDTLSGFLDEHWDISAEYLPYIAFTVILVLIVLLVYITGKVLEGVVNLMALGLLNKLFGMLFGVFKYVLFLSCFLYILQQVDVEEKTIKKEQKENSLLYYPLYEATANLIELFGSGDWLKGFEHIDGLEDFDDFKTQDFYFNEKSSD